MGRKLGTRADLIAERGRREGEPPHRRGCGWREGMERDEARTKLAEAEDDARGLKVAYTAVGEIDRLAAENAALREKLAAAEKRYELAQGEAMAARERLYENGDFRDRLDQSRWQYVYARRANGGGRWTI